MNQIVYTDGAELITGYAASTQRNMRSKGTGPTSFIHNGRIAYRLPQLKKWMTDREAATLRGGAN